MKTEKIDRAPDFGKISLWVDDNPDNKTACTGRVQILNSDGDVVQEVGVYLYENYSKQSERSPDYYGWLKELSPKSHMKSLKKSKSQVVEQYEEDDDDAF